MAAKLAVTACIALTFVGMIGWISPPQVQWPLQPQQLYQVAVRSGEATFDLPFVSADEQYLLVVSNLAADVTPRPVDLGAEAIAVAQTSQLTWLPPLPSTVTGQRAAAAVETATVPSPSASESTPCARSFWLKVGRKDSQNPAAWREIQTDLLIAGRHAAVYVDRTDRVPHETAAAIVEVFDNQVLPRVSPWMGRVADVDGDGRLAIVLTNWLSRLDEGRLALGGMVASADFNPSGEPPMSNRADILYLNANVKPGPHLATLLAHEYTHAAVCSIRREQVSLLCPSTSEEGWLNEALAHVGENLQGPAWTNLDYRIAARLARCGAAPLSLPFDARHHGRCPQVRGSGYLFLRWCVAKFGPELLTRLVQGPRSGIGNLEAATGQRFDRLYREFAVDLFFGWPETARAGEQATVTASDEALPASRGEALIAVPPCYGRLGPHYLAGPRFRAIDLADGQTGETLGTAHVAGTSHANFVLRSSQPGARRVRLDLDHGGRWQVTLVRLGEDRSSLTIQPPTASNTVQLTLADWGTDPVQLEHIAWGEDPTLTADGFTSQGLSLRGQTLEPGGSFEVAVPPEAQLPSTTGGWLHVLARDAAGRPVAGWCDWRTAP